jgi:hypothetical protein
MPDLTLTTKDTIVLVVVLGTIFILCCVLSIRHWCRYVHNETATLPALRCACQAQHRVSLPRVAEQHWYRRGGHSAVFGSSTPLRAGFVTDDCAVPKAQKLEQDLGAA